MNKILVSALIAGVAWFMFKGGSLGGNEVDAFDASGNPIVQVLTIDNCGEPCSSVTKRLKKRGVDFEELQVNLEDKNNDNTVLWEKIGENGFPVTISGNEKVIGPSRAQLAGLLGKNFGNAYLTRSERRYYSKHFNADGTPKIVMYGASWCGYCKKLREEFSAEGIDYIEIDVEKSRDPKRLSSIMEINGYPSVWVGYSRVNGSSLRDVKKTLERS